MFGRVRSILENGHWIFAKQALIVLKKREREMDFGKKKILFFLYWCKLYNIHRVYFTTDRLSVIVSSLGIPLYTDKKTAKSLFLDYARIYIKINLYYEFSRSFWVEMNLLRSLRRESNMLGLLQGDQREILPTQKEKRKILTHIRHALEAPHFNSSN